MWDLLIFFIPQMFLFISHKYSFVTDDPGSSEYFSQNVKDGKLVKFTNFTLWSNNFIP